MKFCFFTLVLAVLFLASIFNTSFAQVNWTKHPNPVLTSGPAGAWDEEFAAFPSVLFDGSSYHMWYGNYNHVNQQFERIGYATSSGGITWQKNDDPTTTIPPFAQSDPVLNPGASGTYDDVGVTDPCVLMINNIYHMWYGGSDYPVNGGTICYATSPDGVVWSKDSLNNPVLDVGLNGTWDDTYVWAPCVVFDDSIYHLWYHASNGSITSIGHATAPHPDSVWTKDPNNPVLDPGSSNSWDYPGVGAPSVIYDGFRFHMFYDGGVFVAWRIGYAWSTDGSNWTKYDKNPVLDWGAAGTFDDMAVSFCSVLLDSVTNTFKMWYTGIDTIYGSYLSAQVGYATAPRVATVINVPADIDSIQGGINLATNGDTVLVQPGTYVENINFNGKNIVVGSLTLTTGDTSYISQTVIDGDSSGSVVTFESGEDSTAALSGFTLTNGNGAWEEGGGISIRNSSPIISNITIINNWAMKGGGVYLENSDAIITHITLHSNHAEGWWWSPAAGGGISCFDSDLILTDSKIRGNFSRWGGGIYSSNSNLYLMNVIISDNYALYGGGIGFIWRKEKRDSSNIFLSNVTIKNNSTDGSDGWPGGGGINCGTHTRLYFDNINRCNIYNNSVDSSVVGCDLYTWSDSIIDIVVDTFTVLSPDTTVAYPLNKFTFDILNAAIPVSIPEKSITPLQYSLKQNYPNPFNPTTTIEFSLPESEHVTLKIYNLLGQEVATLVSDKLKAGSYNYSWDAGSLASGMYFYRLVTENYSCTKKLILLR